MSSSHDDATRALIASDPSFAKDVDAAHAMASIGYGITRLCECGLTGDEMVDSITYVLDLADCDFEQRIRDDERDKIAAWLGDPKRAILVWDEDIGPERCFHQAIASEHVAKAISQNEHRQPAKQKCSRR